QLSSIAKKVYLVARAKIKADEVIVEKVQGADNITLYTGYKPVAIKGQEIVSGLVVQDVSTGKERELDVQGVFVEVGSVPVSQFASDLVELNEKGEIKVDCS
ncbi:FAD-dependent oxidoreductase, partial [Candidatus Saccharibacteria bacterium]|nr:FAD-dependent oxidoreductase [Candidatus Saccharibacteria bacterium]